MEHTDDPDTWLAEQRIEAAVAERRRLSWLGRQLSEGATFAGVLRDLAERGESVVLDGPGRRRHQGVVAVVGDDFVALQRRDGELTLLRTDALAAVHAPGHATPVTGDRPPGSDQTFATAVASRAADRPRIVAVCRDGTQVTGTLVAVGHDVASVRTDGDRPVTAYVSLSSLCEVSPVGSG